jgi:magnesium chelatase family protein
MSRTTGASLRGVDGEAVEVEVRISSQLPRVDVVGLPEAAVRESAARVRAAIQTTGLAFPQQRVTINLAPAEQRKSGAGLDLPIAIGILAAQGGIDEQRLTSLGLFGELALDGRVRPVRGALALCVALRDAGCRDVIAPEAVAAQAALTPGVTVRAARSLADVVAHLREERILMPVEPPALPETPAACPDLADVCGQEHAKRALEITAAGGHALLLRGAPGCGKTMLAARLPGLLPPLDFDEALEVTRIHDAAGQLREGEIIVPWRPFRAPHHSASSAGLLGGGQPPRPGEVSLAHRGVLFLDELPEFNRRSLESLRQVLEDRRIVLARARQTCVFPASFQLVAACNPCKCGWFASGVRDCRCDDEAVARYAARVSGPLLDRIDLHVALQPVPWRELDAPRGDASSATVRARVVAARRLQGERGAGRWRCNAEIPDTSLDSDVAATRAALDLLGDAVDKLGLSARAARRALKVARTIADLSGEETTGVEAMAEALSYRARDST